MLEGRVVVEVVLVNGRVVVVELEVDRVVLMTDEVELAVVSGLPHFGKDT